MRNMTSDSVAAALLLLLSVTSLSQAEIDDGLDDVEVVDSASSSSSSSSPTAEKAEELLRQVVAYGIGRSKELTDVEERNLYEQGVRLDKTNPAHFVGIFNKQKQRGKELADYAYAALETSTLLARQSVYSSLYLLGPQVWSVIYFVVLTHKGSD